MYYTNARIYLADQGFRMGSFEVKDGVFGQIVTDDAAAFIIPENEQIIDLNGATVIPGLIDIHSHGNSGADFSDGDYEGLVKMAAFYAANGVTSFAPTSMTLPYEVLGKAFANVKKLKAALAAGKAEDVLGHEGAVLANPIGIHMEGPYFSYKKRGAQNPDYLKDPDLPGFMKLYEESGKEICIVDVAPELDGAGEFAAQASKVCTVSVAHTDSDYEHAKEVYEAGASHLTHLFNAMPGIHHREPGVIAAAAEKTDVTAEIICDGYHVHPAAVRLAFSLFGAHRIVLISDSGRCAGLAEGTKFMLGGQEAQLVNGVGRLMDGTIACSAANLWQCMKNVMDWGIPEEDAVRAATRNPAAAAGKAGEIGSIAAGLRADFVVTDWEYGRREVYIAGKKLS